MQTKVTQIFPIMGPGKRARAYSAGYLDKGEMNMLSRPGSRKVMTREWLTSMRDRGILVSDATLRQAIYIYIY